MPHAPTPQTALQRYRQMPNIAWREIDGEAVLIDASQGRLLVLNETGLLLWQRLAGTAGANELTEELASTFEVDLAKARQDVEAFLGELSSHQLIECL